MSEIPTDTLPSAVSAAAADRQLGRFRVAYLPDLASSAALSALWIVAAVSGVLLLVGLATGALVATIFAIPFLAIFGYQAISRTVVRNRIAGTALHLFDHGLVKTERDGRVVPLRYDAVSLRYRFVVYKQSTGMVVARKFHFTITDLHTGQISELYAFHDGQTWSDAVRRGVLDARLPGARQQLQTGHPATFTSLTISPTGLTAKGETIPWTGVREVTVDNGVIAVYVDGRRLPWFTSGTDQISDPDIAVQLVRDRLPRR